MLQQSNYLVVLDDLWKTGDWNLLKPAFPLNDTSHHTKVLVTTRNPQLLSSLPSYDAMVFDYEVKLLDHDTSLELLQKNANFDAKDSADNINELCEKMLSHCNGHPLAIVVLGRVLATKKTVEEWQSVADSLPSYLQRDESYMGVYEVLALCYYELPYNIKPCFLHLGHFPEDFEIPAQKLYHIWIAEGIVSSTQDKKVANNSSLEDMCEVYLNKLVQNGMVLVGSGSPSGKINTCRLHDLMRDKCLEINRDEHFVEVIDDYEAVEEQPTNLVTASNQKLRRMTIYADHPCAVLLSLSYGKKLSSVRSLVFFPSYKSEAYEDVGECIVVICKDFQLLRVLDFEDLPLNGSIPKQVGSLIFLRYLSLKGTGITELPSSIGNLRSLIILDLRVKEVTIKIPNQIWKLKFMRHLYFPPRQLSQESHSVPQGYKIENDEMLNLEQLSHLEKLEDVDLDKVDVKGLVKLRSMRKLQATCKSNKESLMPFLKSKSLEMLSLKIHANIVVEDPMALSGCDFLQVLHMDAERGRIYLPMKHNMFPQNLVELGFWYCKFKKDPMPLLETLRKLKNLQLHICYSGYELNCSEKAFPEVTHLIIDGLFSLVKWIVKKGGFPKLEKLEIYNSPIHHLPTVLPPNVDIACSPCVSGVEQYGTCPFFEDC